MSRSAGQVVYPATLCVTCDRLLRPARSNPDEVPGVEHAGGRMCVDCAAPLRAARVEREAFEREKNRRTRRRDEWVREYRFARDSLDIHDWRLIAEHLGVSRSTFYTALVRAKRAGDPRMDDFAYAPRPALSESLRQRATRRAA